MNIKMFAIAALALCTLITQADEQLAVLKANGQVYSNVSVFNVTDTEIFFSSAQGVGNAKLKNLDPDLQKHFNYDPKNEVQAQQKPGTNAAAPPVTPVTNEAPAAVQTEPTAHKNWIPRLSMMALMYVLAIFLAFWIFICFCFSRICEKCGTEPGLLIWVPLFNLIRLLQAGGLSGWLFLLFFVPVAGLVMAIVMWVKVCQARGKTGWLVILLFIPIVNLFFLPYLAFSD